MIEIQGKFNTAKIFTDVVDNASITQVQELCSQAFTAGSRIRLMPDIHAGKGCTIGTTMTITDKVVPNLVGVDIGCLDKETEILTENGWIRIADWSNEKILQYDKEIDTAHFETPNAFIKKPCDEFFHLFTKYGLDQMVSDEHKILAWIGIKNRGYVLTDYIASDFVRKHNSLKKGISGGIKTTFNLESKGLDMSDEDIRVIAMISADGTIRKKFPDHTRVEIHLRKERKVERAKHLLNAAGLDFSCHERKDGTTNFYVHGKPWYTKDLTIFWAANQHQLKTLAEESLEWDGTKRKNGGFSYSTTIKQNADVIQFAFAANGVRCGIQIIDWKKNGWSNTYSVYSTANEIVRFPERNIQKKKSEDGFKYCFTTNTGYFIIRRNNKISITGNCGMETTRIQESYMELQKLDKLIYEKIPSGFSIRDRAHRYLSQIDLNELCCAKHVDLPRAEKSIGTLGGGNHFIEVDKDDEGNLYIVVHSGSRHLGVEVASYYQEAGYKVLNRTDDASIETIIAQMKAEGRKKEIQKTLKKLKNLKQTGIPKALAYVSGELFEQYLHDMKIVQRFAMLNRQAMVDEIVCGLGLHVEEQFTTVHNYIDTESMILRKGAVSARSGEKLLIPINMKDGSLICVGKGNEDWNFSAPHGAGRLMSRAEAKRRFDITGFRQEMDGIYTTSVNESTLDECPMAYKGMDDILSNIGPTVDVAKIIKPIYNFKAGE